MSMEGIVSQLAEALSLAARKKKEQPGLVSVGPDFFEIPNDDRLLVLVDGLEPLDPSKVATSAQDFAGLLLRALGGIVQYDVELGRWHVWNGETWGRCDSGNFRMLKAIAIAIWRMAKNFVGNKRNATCGPDFIGKVEKAMRPFAKAYPPYRGPKEAEARPRFEDVDGVDIWDTHPLLIGILGGMIDLARVGVDGYESELPNKAEQMTKQVLLRPSPRPVLVPEKRHFSSDPHVDLSELEAAELDEYEAPRMVYPRDFCPLFRGLLETATDGDDATMRTVQMFAGYCLSGLTTEHAFLFLYGPGGNGKTLFLNILARILGPYAVSCDISTFTTGAHSNGFSADRARLRGFHMVKVSESGKASEFDQAFLKALTGGDEIVARGLYHNPTGFKPMVKVAFCGNTIPSIATTDRGMRRRMRVIPFKGQPAVIDAELEAKILGNSIDRDVLGNEAPDIFRWILDGWEMFRGNGCSLNVSEGIEDETERYFSTQNPLHAWVSERCEFGKDYRASESELYSSYEAFIAEKNRSLSENFAGEPPLRRHEFLDRLYGTYTEIRRLGRRSYRPRKPDGKTGTPSSVVVVEGVRVRRVGCDDPHEI
ncbi:hypothetical protein B0E45_14615 [Sinorhizobium sp. A49]|nr:hypothetical protein B0E45_14615 [Sinorhizobium sp. A49]